MMMRHHFVNEHQTEIKPVEEGDIYEIITVFTNEGFLPTALEMAKRIKIVKPDPKPFWKACGLCGERPDPIYPVPPILY